MAKKWLIATCLLAAVVVALVLGAKLNRHEPQGRVVALNHDGEKLVLPTTPATVPPHEYQERTLLSVSKPAKTEPSQTTAVPTNVVQPELVQISKPKKTKPPIQDPVARVALSYVGADPEAEAYWYSAINDATLSADERKDLIEDLNEDGLLDPKHPRPEDLPVILSRIQLIEWLAPYAMDDVNADAFAEAHKDLVNLADGQTAQ